MPALGRHRGLHTLLVANRGEIAMRVIRAAQECDIRSVALSAPGDETALHTVCADETVKVESYMDVGAIVDAAVRTKCDALHPGYGFLSESSELAARCEEAGVRFVGPTAKAIEALGDKVAARALARSVGVPVLQGSDAPCADADAVRASMAAEGMCYPVALKAVGGGGGRGIRVVGSDGELEGAFDACLREAAAVGVDGAGLFVEEYLPSARHLEVQLLGDGDGHLIHLWERDCSVQRQRQKMVEVAPAPNLDDATRRSLTEHALRIGNAVGYRSAGTCEFLMDTTHHPRHGHGHAHGGGSDSAGASGGGSAAAASIRFLEFNPRIQVEHTVTEASRRQSKGAPMSPSPQWGLDCLNPIRPK